MLQTIVSAQRFGRRTQTIAKVAHITLHVYRRGYGTETRPVARLLGSVTLLVSCPCCPVREPSLGFCLILRFQLQRLSLRCHLPSFSVEVESKSKCNSRNFSKDARHKLLEIRTVLSSSRTARTCLCMKRFNIALSLITYKVKCLSCNGHCVVVACTGFTKKSAAMQQHSIPTLHQRHSILWVKASVFTHTKLRCQMLDKTDEQPSKVSNVSVWQFQLQ